MADSTENAPLDIYGLMVILTFVFTLGATLALNAELSSNYGYWDSKDAPRASNITKINKDPAKYGNILSLSKEDVDDWGHALKATGKDGSLPVKDFAYPSGYNHLENPVLPNQDNIEKIPEDQRKALLSTAVPVEATTPVP